MWLDNILCIPWLMCSLLFQQLILSLWVFYSQCYFHVCIVLDLQFLPHVSSIFNKITLIFYRNLYSVFLLVSTSQKSKRTYFTTKSNKQPHNSETIAWLSLWYEVQLLNSCLIGSTKDETPSKPKQEHSFYVQCHQLFVFYRRRLCKHYLDALTPSALYVCSNEFIISLATSFNSDPVLEHSLCFHLIFFRIYFVWLICLFLSLETIYRNSVHYSQTF